MRMLAAAALTTFALTSVAACSGDEQAAADPSCGDGPELEIVDTGSEPLEELEFRPEEGASAKLDLNVDVSMSTNSDGSSSPSGTAPQITLGIAATVERVTDDEIQMSFEYDKASVDGDHEFESKLQTLVGTSGTLTTDANGVYLNGNIEPAPGLDEPIKSMLTQFEQQLANLTVPLPSEAVGHGAEWQVTTPIEINGVDTCNAYTYSLDELDGSQYELGIDMSQEMTPGTYDQSGIEVTILEGSATGTGTVRGDLTMPLAVSGTNEVDSTTSMELDLSETREVETETHTTVSIERRDASADADS